MDHAVAHGHVPVTFGAGFLTPRQREIFDLIVIGTSNKEIARELGLSQGTVKIHIAKLFRKLGVRRRGGVALAAANLRLRRCLDVRGTVAPQNDFSLPQTLCSPTSAA